MIRSALILLTALPACIPAPADPTGEGRADPAEALAEAHSRWEAGGMDDYSYTISRHCFCPPEFIGPFEVTVRNGAIQSVTREGATVDTSQVQIPTVPAIFDEIAAAIDARAAEVRVDYDDTLGYPIEVWIDLDHMMADEETGYTVSELVGE